MESRLQQQNDYLQSISFTTNKPNNQASKSSNRYTLNHKQKQSHKTTIIDYATKSDIVNLNKSCISDIRYSSIVKKNHKHLKIVPYQSFKNQQRGFAHIIKNKQSQQLISSQIKWMKASNVLSNYPQQLKPRSSRKYKIQNFINLITESDDINSFKPSLQIRISSPNKDQTIEDIIDQHKMNKYYLPIKRPHQNTNNKVQKDVNKYQNIKSRLAKAVKLNNSFNHLRGTLSSFKIDIQKRQKSQRAQIKSCRTEFLSTRRTRKHNKTLKSLIP